MKKQKTESNTETLTIKQFLIVSIWSIKILFKISKLQTIFYLLFNIIDKLNPLLQAFIFAKALDKIIEIISTADKSFPDIVPYLTVIIAYIFFTTIMGYLKTITGQKAYHKGKPALNRMLYQKLQQLGIETIEQPEINNQINRTKDIVDTLTSHMDNLIILISDIIKIISTTTIVVIFIPWSIPIIALIVIPYFIFDRVYRKKLYKFILGSTEEMRKADESAADLTNSKKLEEITINDAFDFIDKKYISFWKKYTTRIIRIVNSGVTGLYINQILYDILTAVSYIWIFVKVIQEKITVGNAVFAIRSLQLMQDTLTDTVLHFNKIYEYSIKLNDTYQLFQTKPRTEDGNIVMPMLKKGPAIQIKDITFKYPNTTQPIFENFNLDIKSGEKIAIVGHNGAGKATLVKLLARFYECSNGNIFINNLEIKQLKISSYYKNLGIMFQEYNTYPQLTVNENISIGRPDISDTKQIINAAKQADAHEFVNALPQKYKTLLSEKYENGLRLSTGQWQKLAIARFFYRDPSLVIFDEPTASIDAVSEYNIFNRIYNSFKNKTVIIISHRFSTVRNADRIIVMKNGKIVEQGSHKQLLEKEGVYANAFNLRAEGYK